MKERVFKLVFEKNSYELNMDYDKFTQSELEIIANVLPDNYFEWNSESGNYTIIMIVGDHPLLRYTNILKNNNVKFKLVNLTNEILENGINLSEDLIPHINIINSTKWTKFKQKIVQWTLSNLTVDIVLDRINRIGSYDKLSKLEKKFLEDLK